MGMERILQCFRGWKWPEFMRELSHGPKFRFRVLTGLEWSQKGSEKRPPTLCIKCLLCPRHLKYLIPSNPQCDPVKEVQSVSIALSCLVCNLGTGFLVKSSWLINGAEIICKICLTSEHIPAWPTQGFCVKQSRVHLWEDMALRQQRPRATRV